jgi:allophanate hydrolase
MHRLHDKRREKALTTLASIAAGYRDGAKAADVVEQALDRIAAYGDPALFIALRGKSELIAEARKLAPGGALHGVPVAVKDNIDVAGMPTTAGCPAYAYTPGRDATVIARLKAAGALIVGKTNLDQFATGLVGTRSPYGVPRNPLRADLIPGGSSSGSATAVAAGLVPVTLGTDTAGSGRVPAMLNNIVGLKPSLGMLSTAGVVPACRTLDCVSLFALTVADAWTALAAIAGPDPHDIYSRSIPLGGLGAMPPGVRIGVPSPGERIFFGDQLAADAYADAISRLEKLGTEIVTFDIEPFYETARLLYEGPWLAERFLTVRDLLASSPDAIHPVTREIIVEGARPSAADAFAAFYKLEELRRIADATFRGVDALALPSAPTVYTVEQVLADPRQLNSRLGTYTNFVNLLNLCAIAVPASMRSDGAPFGITLIAPAGRDAFIASVAGTFHAATGLTLGATDLTVPAFTGRDAPAAPGTIEIAVVGAHMSGLPLNRELVALGATFRRAGRTVPHYRFYLLAGGPPQRPGLVRVESGGGAIEAEIWALPTENVGRFIAGIPAPLGIGTVDFEDGAAVKGFLAEAAATHGARDITSLGGWRAFLQSEARKKSA